MLFHQKLRHNMDVKLNKALEERYLQIVANQRQKQMREERKKAALNTKDSPAWFHQDVQAWMLQSHLHSQQQQQQSLRQNSVGADAAGSSHSRAGEVTTSPPPHSALTARDSSRTSPRVSSSAAHSDDNAVLSSKTTALSNSSDMVGTRHASDVTMDSSNSMQTDDGGQAAAAARCDSEKPMTTTTQQQQRLSSETESRCSDAVFKDDTADDESPDVNEDLMNGSSCGSVAPMQPPSQHKHLNTRQHSHHTDDMDTATTNIYDDDDDDNNSVVMNNDEQSERKSSTETADSADSPRAHATANEMPASLHRVRELMFTPEPAATTTTTTNMAADVEANMAANMASLTNTTTALETLGAFDDNCNLKENFDRMIMSAFGKFSIDNYCMAASLNAAALHAAGGGGGFGDKSALFNAAAASPTDGNGQETQSTSANNGGDSMSPEAPQNTGGGGGANGRRSGDGSNNAGDADDDDDDDLRVDYPALFPGLKHHLNIRNETVIISRLDGVNRQTGDRVSLYKCYLCGRVFNQLSVLQLHLSTHFEKRVTYYQCLYCDACYRFKAQLVQHLQTHHRVQLNLEEGQIPQVTHAVVYTAQHHFCSHIHV